MANIPERFMAGREQQGIIPPRPNRELIGVLEQTKRLIGEREQGYSNALAPLERDFLFWTIARELAKDRLSFLTEAASDSFHTSFVFRTMSDEYKEALSFIRSQTAAVVRNLWQGKPIEETYTGKLLEIKKHAIELVRNGQEQVQPILEISVNKDDRYLVFGNNGLFALGPRESALLRYLLEHKETGVSSYKIIREVFDGTMEVRRIPNYIRVLSEKLKDAGDYNYIERLQDGHWRFKGKARLVEQATIDGKAMWVTKEEL